MNLSPRPFTLVYIEEGRGDRCAIAGSTRTRSGLRDLRGTAHHQVVQELRREVRAVGPDHRVELRLEPHLPEQHRAVILELPVLELSDGYWIRAAATRALLLAKRLRTRLPDTLIAQSCLDNDVALITRDTDFRHFARHCGLRLA